MQVTSRYLSSSKWLVAESSFAGVPWISLMGSRDARTSSNRHDDRACNGSNEHPVASVGRHWIAAARRAGAARELSVPGIISWDVTRRSRWLSTDRESRKPEVTPSRTPHGWSFGEVFTLANTISLARLLSAPLIAHWIVQGEWVWALTGLVLAGISDWADGYCAARFKQSSVLGSYLDPLADKVLIAGVIGALGWQGILSGPVVAVVVSRDVLLVLGGFYHRASMLKWRATSVAEFFRVLPDAEGQAAPRIKPIAISKLNTVLQLTVVGTCVIKELVGVPPSGVVDGLVVATLATTVVSGIEYVRLYRAGRLL